MNFKNKFNEYLDIINLKLHNMFDDKSGSTYESMKYSLYAGGKRIRPVLTLASCDALGGDKEAALCFGCALEMIHTYSLIHDDLPCMDNDDLRRGKPTNHIVFGEHMAVLAGDALLNFACESIVKSPLNLDPSVKLKALDVLYSASGAEGMIGGQVMDIRAENEAITAQELEILHNKKTGALINAAASLGAIASGEDEKLFHNYTSSLGLAFQIRDDILDVESDTETFGKPVNSDVKNNKTTYVSLYGIEGAKKLLREETEKAVSSIEFLEEKGSFLTELAFYLLERKY